ncbi:sugar O-acetyltransferase [Zeaxanthinibacter enoshimensis]|uniref:Acetyltransferase n=1 Tax=Zeaxanthinibacter enoshimensis TaxID=392009 RepID=A0A4R6TT90_9FLAO|nr:sugar O-acetyltransferase [Zeaxanthinibacter enoshimensis]TDQ33129.1 maltose O-acetyltransferase [Zeaxanthinibacter enoshimensis]
MTEKQKMLAGQAYDSRDPELLKMYHRARALLQQYNSLDSTLATDRDNILQQLVEEVAPGVWIEAPFFCDYGSLITIAENTFVNANCMFMDNNHIRIGKNGLIGPGVHIYTAQHPLKAEDRIVTAEDGSSRYLTTSQPVHIGDNAWIGGNTVICPGVSIGNNVTIGAGSVVTKDIPDNVLAYGNPCRVIRSL